MNQPRRMLRLRRMHDRKWKPDGKRRTLPFARTYSADSPSMEFRQMPDYRKAKTQSAMTALR
jgi:hypothetical protein